MAGLWYRVGTVTLTNGSKAVVGYGTKWKSANPLPGKGSMLCGPDGKVYEVDTVADDTNMTLVSNYTGPSGAGQGYALVLMALTIPQFSTQLSQFVQKNSLFASQINTLLTATGDVNLTDPDSGLVIKVPSWSKIASEGEGQAARAKVEADKAVAAAATAVNVVREAALRLPDVWAPLSDSLRLITGYGREVKVGDDVVARYVNFERLSSATYIDKSGVLRLAAVNEPRFEREGLLIEGASTNFVERSDIATWRTPTEVVVTSGQPSLDGGNAAVKLSKTANNTNSYVRDVLFSVLAGEQVTFSVYAKAGEFKNIRLSCDGTSVWVGNAQPRLQVDLATGQVKDSVGFTSYGVTALSNGWFRLSATITAATDGQTRMSLWVFDDVWSTSGDGVKGFFVFGAQAEKAGAASSYIPTNGAYGTRSADFPTLPRSGNDNYFGRVSITAEIHLNPRGSEVTNDARRGVLSGYPSVGAFQVLMVDPSVGRIGWAYGGSSFSGGTNQPQLTDGLTHAVTALMDGAVNRTYTDAVKGSVELAATPVFGADNGTAKERWHIGYGAGGSTARHLWGHIRNLRIWHRALTDAQIKAIN